MGLRERLYGRIYGALARTTSAPAHEDTLSEVAAGVGTPGVIETNVNIVETQDGWVVELSLGEAKVSSAPMEQEAATAQAAVWKRVVRDSEEITRRADRLGWMIWENQPADLPGYAKFDFGEDDPRHLVYRQSSVARGVARNAAKFVWWSLGSGEMPEPWPEESMTWERVLGDRPARYTQEHP